MLPFCSWSVLSLTTHIWSITSSLQWYSCIRFNSRAAAHATWLLPHFYGPLTVLHFCDLVWLSVATHSQLYNINIRSNTCYLQKARVAYGCWLLDTSLTPLTWVHPCYPLQVLMFPDTFFYLYQILTTFNKLKIMSEVAHEDYVRGCTWRLCQRLHMKIMSEVAHEDYVRGCTWRLCQRLHMKIMSEVAHDNWEWLKRNLF